MMIPSGQCGRQHLFNRAKQTLKELKVDSKGLSKPSIKSLYQNNPITFRNLVVSAATGGLEHLLNARAFNCPENSHQLYGYSFLIAPILILFCVNLLVIGEIWKFTSRRCVKRYKRRGDVVARLIPSLLKACVGPAVWLIVAFLEEDYYLCAKLGPFPSRGNETSAEEIDEWNRQVEEYKALSHVWAWIVLVSLVIFGTVVVISKHCFVKENIIMHNHFAYERREALGAMKRFTELMNPGTEFKYKDADLDNDPKTAEYGAEDEKIKYYNDGFPEKIGEKTVDKLFEGWKEGWQSGDKWHYMKAFKDFKKMYPRISTGNPLDPWRAVEEGTEDTDLKPLYVEKPKQSTAVSTGNPLDPCRAVDEGTKDIELKPNVDKPQQSTAESDTT